MRALTSVLVLSVATLVACDRSATLEHVPGPSDDVAIFEALLVDECMYPRNPPTPEIVLDVPADVVSEEMASWKWHRLPSTSTIGRGVPAARCDGRSWRHVRPGAWPRKKWWMRYWRRTADPALIRVFLLGIWNTARHRAGVAAGLLRRWAVGRRPSDIPA
jgi:hypothetical protein